MFGNIIFHCFWIVATSLLAFVDFGINKSPIPPSLEESKQKALLAVKESTFSKITITEICKTSPK
jgi:hypothetical protein